MIQRFRKKAVVISAEQFFPGISRIEDVEQKGFAPEGGPLFVMQTLEGEMRVRPGDWIITGVAGERYPCRADIFSATYEPAEEDMRMRTLKRTVVDDLFDEIKEKAYRYAPEGVILASGRTSHHYFDLKKVFCTGKGNRLWAEWFRGAVLPIVRSIDAVGGPELGAVFPAGSLTAHLDLPSFVVRKESKTHGTRAMVEGVLPAHGRVIMLEDAITTGGSVWRAIEEVERQGVTVVGIACMVLRAEELIPALRRYPIWAPWTLESFVARTQQAG